MMIPFSFKRISDFKSRQLQLIFLKYIEHGPLPILLFYWWKISKNSTMRFYYKQKWNGKIMMMKKILKQINA